ncbi:MAG: bifunctional nuclease family protein [Anaerolineae bacterium]|nr:bifunctional nuclease family protein [Anaerolineae bacterium]
MIEVTIESIRISLMSPERAVLLKEVGDERQLPIFIHSTEADAILLELQGYPQHPRPLTHDLLKNVIEDLGGVLQYVEVNDLKDDIFYALLHVAQDGREVDIDARPSDSIALAVRAKVPIYVAESVMERAGIYPAEDMPLDEEALSEFRDFVDTLDMDGLTDE